MPETTEGSGIIKSITDALFSSLGNIGALLTNALIVILIAVFFLINPYEYKKVLISLIPKKHQEHAHTISSELKKNLQSWIKTLGLSISVTFVLVWLALSLIGFPYAFVIALIAGLATFIPNVGAIVPIVPIIIFGISATNPVVTLWAAVIYVAIQLTESNIITPSLMKASLNILPAGILIFQIIAAQVFGVLGVLLSVPILVVIIVLVKELHVKRFS
jgi:predicted PurR-regulated permease PerM